MLNCFQFEEKLQMIINQQMAWYEHEKSVLVSQIQSLHAILNQTERNFTDTIEQVHKSFHYSITMDFLSVVNQ